MAFLDSLVQPVVPSYLHARCLQVKDAEAAFEVCLCGIFGIRTVKCSLSCWASSLVNQSMYVTRFHWCECVNDIPRGDMDIIDGLPPLHQPTVNWG